MKIALASDHAGFELKNILSDFLKKEGHAVADIGVHDSRPADYPDYALKVGQAVVQGRAQRGIMVCGSGVGGCVAANKIPGVRAGLCHDTFSARQGVEDDDINVLCLGSRVIGSELAHEIVRAFLEARFSGLARHARRKKKVLAIERKFMRTQAR